MIKTDQILVVEQYVNLNGQKMKTALTDWISLVRIVSTPLTFQINRNTASEFNLTELEAKINHLNGDEDVWWILEGDGTKFQVHLKRNTLFCCSFLTKSVFSEYSAVIDDYLAPRMREHGVYAYIRSFDEYRFNNVGNIASRDFDSPMERENLPKRYDVDRKVAIDCNKLAGYDLYYEGLCLTSCWKMYYSKYYYRYIPRPIFESVQQIYQIKEHGNGLLEITLYKNPWHWDLDVNLNYQRFFRDQVGFDQLAWENGVGVLREPYIEFAFEADQVHTVSYFDSYGQPTKKKQASIFITRTFNYTTGQYSEHKMKGHLNAQAYFPWVDEKSQKMMNYCIINPEYALDSGVSAFEFYIRQYLEINLDHDPHYNQYQTILRFYLPQVALFHLSFNFIKEKMSDVEFVQIDSNNNNLIYDLKKGDNHLRLVFMDYSNIMREKQFKSSYISKY